MKNYMKNEYIQERDTKNEYIQEREELRKTGSLYIYPQLDDKWNEFVSGLEKPLNIAILKRCLKMMEALENDPTFDNMMSLATKTVSEIDGYALAYARGIMYNFCKYGPEFCLALEIANEDLKADFRHDDETSAIEIARENAVLLLDKMLENSGYRNDIDEPKRSI